MGLSAGSDYYFDLLFVPKQLGLDQPPSDTSRTDALSFQHADTSRFQALIDRQIVRKSHEDERIRKSLANNRKLDLQWITDEFPNSPSSKMTKTLICSDRFSKIILTVSIFELKELN